MLIGVERYDDVIGEAAPMLKEHYHELSAHKDIELDPDFELYEKLSAAGALRVYTVRDGSTIFAPLVGYALFFIRKHMHYKQAGWAVNDLVWLHPKFRNFGAGSKLVDFWDADLAELGIHVVRVDTKAHSPALERLLVVKGYGVIGSIIEKRLV